MNDLTESKLPELPTYLQIALRVMNVTSILLEPLLCTHLVYIDPGCNITDKARGNEALS